MRHDERIPTHRRILPRPERLGRVRMDQPTRVPLQAGMHAIHICQAVRAARPRAKPARHPRRGIVALRLTWRVGWVLHDGYSPARGMPAQVAAASLVRVVEEVALV